MILTMEFDPRNKSLEISCDKEGIESLRTYLAFLMEKSDHIHLMTESWGGYELTEHKYFDNTILIHQFNIGRFKNENDVLKKLNVKRLNTFEYQSDNVVNVICDLNGIKFLHSELSRLDNLLTLRTPALGGTELTEEQYTMEKNAVIIDRVDIYRH